MKIYKLKNKKDKIKYLEVPNTFDTIEHWKNYFYGGIEIIEEKNIIYNKDTEQIEYITVIMDEEIKGYKFWYYIKKKKF